MYNYTPLMEVCTLNLYIYAAHFYSKPEKSRKIKMRATDTARGITVLLPHGFDVDLGRIGHPQLEEKL